MMCMEVFGEIEVATKARMRLLVRQIERVNPDGHRRHALCLVTEAIEKPYIPTTRRAAGTSGLQIGELRS